MPPASHCPAPPVASPPPHHFGRRLLRRLGFWLLSAVVWVLATAAKVIRKSFNLPADALAQSWPRSSAQTSSPERGPTSVRGQILRGATTTRQILVVAVFFVTLAGDHLMAAAAAPLFRHHSIARTIPQAKNSTWGFTRYHYDRNSRGEIHDIVMVD